MCPFIHPIYLYGFRYRCDPADMACLVSLNLNSHLTFRSHDADMTKVCQTRQRLKGKPSEFEKALQFCERDTDPDGLEKVFINSDIGYGVFARKKFEPNQFLVEYCGELISSSQGEQRFEAYGYEKGCFLFFYGDVCIDATNSDRIGRFINDATKGKNCQVKPVRDRTGRLHLCIFGLPDRHIDIGDELRFSYGTGSSFKWRKSASWSQWPYRYHSGQVWPPGHLTGLEENLWDGDEEHVGSIREFTSQVCSSYVFLYYLLLSAFFCLLVLRFIGEGLWLSVAFVRLSVRSLFLFTLLPDNRSLLFSEILQ